MADDFELPEEEEKRKPAAAEKPIDLGPMLMAALAILLLAFFILLVSMATVDTEKRKEALASVSSAFGILEGGAGIMGGPSINRGGPTPQRARFAASLSLFQDFVKARGLADDVILQGSYKGFTISLSEGVVFQGGGAKINPKSYILLDTVKFIIADGKEKFRVRIEGHTDDAPIASEQFPSNWELSVARAMSVLRYFLRDRGVRTAQLEAAGFASYRPKYPNDSPGNRARNRRVDITFLLKKKPKAIDPKESIEINGFRFQF